MAYLGSDALEEGHRPVDLRLFFPAAGLWALVWWLLSASASVALAVSVAAFAATAAALPWWRRPRAGAAAGVAVMFLLCSAGGALAVAGRHAAVAGSPVTAAAEAEERAAVGVVVAGDPRPRSGAPQPGRAEYVIEARTEWVERAGERVRSRATVVILASGARWRELLPSQRLVVEGKLVPADSPDFTAALVLVRGPPGAVEPPSRAHAAAGAARAALREACAGLPQPERGLVPAVVVGDVSELPPETAEDFRVTGLTHIMVPSGAKLAIMLGVALALARALRLPLPLQVAAGAAMIGVFVLLCRPEPSVLRAAVMGGIALLALALGRPRAGFTALTASVIGLLLFDPQLARSYGFALSVLATAGLLVLAPRWRDRWSAWLPRPLAEAGAVALAAQLAVYPVLVLLSGEVGLLAVPANLLATPLVPVATIAGFLVAAVAPAATAAARLGVWVPAGAVAWINAVAEQLARPSFSTVPWPGDTAGAVTLAVLLAVAVAARGRFGGLVALGTGAALVAALAVAAVFPSWPPRDWALVVCDVGQGDAVVLSAGGPRAAVIDTGIDPVAVDRCLRDLGVREIELLVLTHDDADHVAGTPGVLRHREVRLALAPDGFAGSDTAALLARRGVPLHGAAPGGRFAVGEWRLTVLWPPRGADGGGNEDSVVLRADLERPGAAGKAQNIGVLLTGDIEETAQGALLADPEPLDVDVLKTPHHGAAAQDPDFLAATRPRVTLTSVGEGNSYGHPAPETWALLTALAEANYRTDLHGDIAVVAAPEGMEVAVRGKER